MSPCCNTNYLLQCSKIAVHDSVKLSKKNEA